MGTHPIFESDFDCLTETSKSKKMSVGFNLKGADWAADKQKAASGDEAEYWSKLELNAKKKLWHQLTVVLLDVIQHKRLSKTSNLELYQNFVAEFEIKLNKLSLMEVIIKAVDDINEPQEAHVFLDKLQPKVADCLMSKMSTAAFTSSLPNTTRWRATTAISIATR